VVLALFVVGEARGFVPAAKIPEMQQRINEAATQAGRDPSSIRRNYT
jgi:hypothetical protein